MSLAIITSMVLTMKGIRGWAGVKTKPTDEQIPYEDRNAKSTFKRPIPPKIGYKWNKNGNTIDFSLKR